MAMKQLTFYLSCLALCAVHGSPLVVNHWEHIAQPASEKTVTIHVYVHQANKERLRAFATAVSRPGSAEFGKHLTLPEIIELVGNNQAIAEVTSWLSSEQVNSVEVVSTRDALTATMSVAKVERLFGVRMGVFRHKFYRKKVVHRSTSGHAVWPPHLPIEAISGVHDFPTFRKRNARSKSLTVTSTQPGAHIVWADNKDVTDIIDYKFYIVCADGNPTVRRDGQLCDRNGHLADDFLLKHTMLDGRREGSDKPTGHCGRRNCSLDEGQGVVICQCGMRVGRDPHSPRVATICVTLGGKEYCNRHPYTVAATSMNNVRTVMAYHNIPSSLVVHNSSVTQGVVEFEEQYMSTADLSMFLEMNGIENSEATRISFVGPNLSPAGDEASLDIQWMMGLARESPTTFWSMPQNSTVEIDDILTWTLAVANDPRRAMVYSVSYGMPEINVDKYLGKGYLARSDSQFQVLAALGVTLVVSSGDNGAYDLGKDIPSTNTCEATHPDWPCQSPWITCVGSTYPTPFADPQCWAGRPEVTNISASYYIDCSDFPIGHAMAGITTGLTWTTGGGFSNVQPTADYQRAEVAHYLSQNIQFPRSYNRNGRVYPDLAAIGHSLVTIYGGRVHPIDGTSASAPIVAAMVTLINGERVKNGKRPLGFVNPSLYEIYRRRPEAFTDITVGDNVCGTYLDGELCCEESRGFRASRGFDAVSGLGAPNFAVLLEEAMKL